MNFNLSNSTPHKEGFFRQVMFETLEKHSFTYLTVVKYLDIELKLAEEHSYFLCFLFSYVVKRKQLLNLFLTTCNHIYFKVLLELEVSFGPILVNDNQY